MAKTPDLTNEEKYLKSECWKCDDSPTGAHHWKEYDGLWVCKYCGEVRKWPKTFYEAMEREGKSQKVPLSVIENLPIPKDNFRIPKSNYARRKY